MNELSIDYKFSLCFLNACLNKYKHKSCSTYLFNSALKKKQRVQIQTEKVLLKTQADCCGWLRITSPKTKSCAMVTTAEGMLTSHLSDFDPLKLLLSWCERGRTWAGCHMTLVAQQADVLLVLQAQQEALYRKHGTNTSKICHHHKTEELSQ